MLMRPIPKKMTPIGSPNSSGGLVKHGADVAGADEEQDAGQADRQQGDDVAAVALHGGQGLDLALDAEPLADREGDRVEDRGEVAADL